MSAQLSLVYPPEYVGAEAWKRQLEAIRSAVMHLGLKDVAFTLDVSGSMVSDALNERDRKRWAAEWTHVLKAMLAARYSDETAAGMLRAIVEADVAASGFQLVDPDNLTPEQLVAAMSDEERERIRKRVKGGRRR